MNTVEILRKAREFLSKEENWCPTGPQGPNGSRCVVTALLQVGGSLSSTAMFYLYEALPDDFKREAGRFNDTPGRKHSEILELFDRAIALAEKDLKNDAR